MGRTEDRPLHGPERQLRRQARWWHSHPGTEGAGQQTGPGQGTEPRGCGRAHGGRVLGRRALLMSHWYSRTGEPCHYVAGPNGSRPATLADARKNGWLPGYSAVDRMIHNHFLTEWIKNEAVKAARTLRPLPDEPETDFVRRINAEASRKATEAAAAGKAIHYAIEAHFRGEAVPDGFEPYVAAVLRMLEDNFPQVSDWVSEHTFACRDGYGGGI